MTNDLETQIRIVEAFNALSMIIPIDDPEARASFRAAFGADIGHMLPKFFMDISHRAAEFDRTLVYFELARRLSNYVLGHADSMPNIEGIDENFWHEARKKAEKLMRSWNRIPKKEKEK